MSKSGVGEPGQTTASETLMRWELLRILAGARNKRNTEIAANEQVVASKETEEPANEPSRPPSGLDKLNIKGPLDASNVEAVEAELHRLAAEQADHPPESSQIRGDRGHRPLMLPHGGDRSMIGTDKGKAVLGRSPSSPRRKPRSQQPQSRGSSESQQTSAATPANPEETEHPTQTSGAFSSSPHDTDRKDSEGRLQDGSGANEGLAGASDRDAPVSEAAATETPSQDAISRDRLPSSAEASQPAELSQSQTSDPVEVLTPDQEQDSSALEDDSSTKQEQDTNTTAPVDQEMSPQRENPQSSQPPSETSQLPPVPEKKNPTLNKNQNKPKSASKPAAVASSSPPLNRVDGDFTPEQLFQLLMVGCVPKDLGSKKNSWSAMQLMLQGMVYSSQGVLGATGRKASLAVVEAFNM